jgi:multiple sugar transport system substrate-binding protein
MVLFLVGAGAFATGTQEGSASVQEPEMFEIGIFGNETHMGVIDGLLDSVRAERPGMEISIITVPWGEYVQKLSVLQLSGDAPDIVWAADTHLQAFMENDILVDISAIRNDGDSDYDFDDFTESSLEFVTKDGNLYGIPFSVAPTFIIYNEDLFEAAGLETPYSLWQRGDWNYETFREAVVGITDKASGTYGYPPIEPSGFMLLAMNFLWGYGAEPFNDDLSQFTLNTPEGRDAMQFIWDLYNEDDVLPLPGELEPRSGFNSGRLAMAQSGVSDLNRAAMTGDVDFNWSIAPMPEGPADGPVRMGYAAWAVLNDRHSEDTILDVLKAVTNVDATTELSQFFLTGRASVIQSDELTQRYPVDADVFRAVVLGSLERGRVPVFPANYAQMQAVIQAAVEDMIINDVSVDDTIEAMETNLEEYF